MAKVTTHEVFQADLDWVWKIVTDNTHYSWRSDLSRIEVIDNVRFVEYTKEGIATEFTITCKEEKKRYEFDMKNKNMRGHWIGVFRKAEGGTEIDFTEDIKSQNPIMNLFAGIYLKKQQKQYIEDLKKELKEK
ncbi:MAG: SRPBCC family protein [Bacteroides sp.]|nr:SRPBCC family protein [Bacteroides sp.]MCM1548971.1 SRPBCC family protein [Clostridium sp.]